MILRLKLICILLLLSCNVFAQILNVEISGIKCDEGVIVLAFFTNQESFDEDDPVILKTVKKDEIYNGTLTVSFDDIPPGKYGIALLDDKNENGKMDYNFIGLPKEGFGFSNFYQSGFFRPKFNDFAFAFYNDKIIKIRIRYI